MLKYFCYINENYSGEDIGTYCKGKKKKFLMRYLEQPWTEPQFTLARTKPQPATYWVRVKEGAGQLPVSYCCQSQVRQCRQYPVLWVVQPISIV